MSEKITYIYGKHAVREVCTVLPRAVRLVYLADSAHQAEYRALGVSVEALDTRKLPGGITKDAVHQGYIAAIDLEKLMVPYAAFKETLTVTPHTALLILGEVQDPHNVGAIIRSAAAFGISGVLVPEHRQAQLTGVVAKASAGMVFRIPIVSIGNVNAVVRDLKKGGFWVYGLDGEASSTVAEEGFEKPSVFIVGNEGAGIRQKTLEHCDIVLKIPMAAHTESLNASVAAAIVCYAWSQKHPHALTNPSHA